MLSVYIPNEASLKRVEVTNLNALPQDAVWIDLKSPTSEEDGATQRFVGIEIPTREDMDEIEISSRLYVENGARYMTATLMCATDTGNPRTTPVSFILVDHRLVTVRYDEPKPFNLVAAKLSRACPQSINGENLLLDLLDAIVDRCADILERIGADIDEVSLNIFQPSATRGHAANYSKILLTIGKKGDLTSKVRESLVSIGRLVSFVAVETDTGRWTKDQKAAFKTIQRDVQSLTDHASYLANKITFTLDAMLGVVNLEQNNIIKLFSVMAVVLMPPTADRLGLRHEFQEHAGAGMDPRLSDGDRDDDHRRDRAVPDLQMEEVVVSQPSAFDFSSLFARDLPPAAARWAGFSTYHFIGGNNDADLMPLDDLIAAANSVMKREGRNLATYNLLTGPHGYRPLRDFLVGKLKRDAGISSSADDILITSGSLQGLDLVNAVLTEPGDTVIIEQDCYEGSIKRLLRRGVTPVGIPLDDDGMRMDALRDALADLKTRGIRPKYIYVIPTVQNPTATIMSEARRRQLLALADEFGVPIFEDDCYADLIWDGQRPPALHAMRRTRQRDLYRFILEVGRACTACGLHRGAVGRDVAHPVDEDRCWLRLARANGARRILPDAFPRACAGVEQGPAQEVRGADGRAIRTVRNRGRIRRSEGRHLPLGQVAGSGRYDAAQSRRAEGRRRDQSRRRVVGRCGAFEKPSADLFCQPERAADSRGRRGAGAGLS